MNLKLCFIDTVGQERYMNSFPKNYIRDSQIVLLVFSDIESLVSLQKRWYYFYEENTDITKSKFIVVGKKSDTFGENKHLINKLGEKFIDAFYITCSAKSEDNIDNLLNHIVTETKRLIDEEEKNSNINDLNNTKEENSCKK